MFTFIIGACCAVVYVFERYKEKTYSLEYAFYAIYAIYGGVGLAAALSYMCMKDISKKDITLNMHSMQSMQNMGWGGLCGVLYQFERYKQKM